MESGHDLIGANIRRARTFRGVAPEQYRVPYRSIGELLDRRAHEAPEQLFLLYYNDDAGGQSSLTYRAFNERVNRMANLLARSYRVQRADRVAIMAFNHPDVAVIYYACWKLGATPTPQNMSEDDTRIAFIVQNAGCKVALVRPEYLARAKALQSSISCLEYLVAMNDEIERDLDTHSSIFSPAVSSLLEDEGLLVYTSGTTGAPKGVQLSQYNLLVDAQSMCEWQHITAETRMMCVLPIHHVNGIVATLINPVYAGSSVVLLRAFKVSTFWRRLAQDRVHIVSVVPTLLQFLCEANEDIARYDLSALRHLICGAGTLAVALAQRFEEQFGVRILHAYGLSETTCFSCQLPIDHTDAEHQHWMRDFGYPSIGVDFGANEMTIHDSGGNELAAGEKGEIVIRGHNVMLGYFQRPDANREAFEHGWFRTGDEGFFQRDEKGRKFFFITGRIKELINRGGVKYSPFEIEEVLLEIPGVKVGLAIAFDNDWYGEEVGAYIVRDAGASVSEEQILTHCRKRMSFSKAPKVVKFGAEIPVTTTGKYQRLRLKELFAEYQITQFKDVKI